MKQIEKIWDWLSNYLLPHSNETIKVVVLCVVTATTFWFFNALNDNYSTRITYPIKFTYPDSALVEVTEIPKKVSINVSGGGWNLLRKTFWFTITPVEVPLEDPVGQKYILGNSLYSLIADQMTEIQLNFVENDTLKLDIDSLKSTTAKLAVDSSKISLTNGYQITSTIVISHDSVSFTGPERFIKEIPNTISLYIEEKNISSDYSKDMYLPTFGSSLVNRNPVEVEVSFSVAKFIKQELMLPFQKINQPADSNLYIFSDSLARMSFQIKEELAGNFDLDSIKLIIDFDDIKPSDSIAVPKAEMLPHQLMNREITFDSIQFNYLDK